MSSLIVNSTALQEAFKKLEGHVVTLSSSDLNNDIVRTFHKLEFYEDHLFYYFAETEEECVSWQVSKRRINWAEMDMDTVVLHMSNGAKIIISTDVILDKMEEHTHEFNLVKHIKMSYVVTLGAALSVLLG